jgi:hypothetical protein
MKFEKLDKKQLPQVVVLGVLTLGVVGFGGFKLLSGSSAAPVQADGAPKEPAETAQNPENPQGGPKIAVPGEVFKSDPFQPVVKPTDPNAPAPPVAPPPAKGTEPDRPRTKAIKVASNGGGAPVLPSGSPAPQPAAPVAPVAPSGPAVVKPAPPLPPMVHVDVPADPGAHRPQLHCVGVVEGKPNLALLRFKDKDNTRRIVQAGDVLPGGYKVRQIALDGLVLDSGRDRFFVPVGEDKVALAQ